MDKIVVLVLTIAVTLGLFSFSVLGEAANARDLVSYAEQEQNEVQFLLENPNVVTAEYVFDYYQKYKNADFSVTVFNETLNVVETDDEAIFDYNYYRVNKEYTNGTLSEVSFTVYTES